MTLNICNGAPGAIAVAPAIWIVKASKNQNSYGNTIELNFLLKGQNLLLKSVFNNVCLWPFHVRTWEYIFLWLSFQSVKALSILWHRNIGLCLAEELNSNRKKNTLIPNRVRGAIFDLVGSFDNNIGGDPACVSLSLEGLSEATTRKPHGTCSMWMTWECASSKYARAKELTEFNGVQDGGVCDFPLS